MNLRKTIKKQKIITFAETLKKKTVVLNGKQREICQQRNRFGSLLIF